MKLVEGTVQNGNTQIAYRNEFACIMAQSGFIQITFRLYNANNQRYKSIAISAPSRIPAGCRFVSRRLLGNVNS